MIDLEDFRTVIFHHVPKTAGMTMSALLDQVVPAERIRTIAPRNEPDHEASLRAFLALPEEELRKIRILRGHDVYGFDRHLPQPAAYFTVLRDPARRLVSSYHHLLHAPAHLPERKAFVESPPSLREYVEEGDIYLGRNSQLKTFIGYDPGAGAERSETALLERATRALHEEYALVGLTERFDETLVLAADRFGWTVGGYARRNVSRAYDPSALDPEILARYRERNPEDVEFYARAKNLFEERIGRYDGDFDRALAARRRANARHRGVRWLRSAAGAVARLLPGRR